MSILHPGGEYEKKTIILDLYFKSCRFTFIYKFYFIGRCNSSLGCRLASELDYQTDELTLDVFNSGMMHLFFLIVQVSFLVYRSRSSLI